MSQFVDLNSITGSLDSDTKTFKERTARLNDLNEIYNANTQLNDINQLELIKINEMNDTLQNQVNVAKQKFLLQEYGIHAYAMRNSILLFTLVVVAVVFFIAAMFVQNVLTGNTVLTIAGVLFILYALIVFFIVRAAGNRRKSSWNKLYFAGMQ